jgi:hypothetical protein
MWRKTRVVVGAGWTNARLDTSAMSKPEEAEMNRGSFRLDEEVGLLRKLAGSGDLQLSSHADADAEVCLKGAQQPELHASW